MLTVLYLLVGAPIMYLYLSTTGGLMARALRFAAFQLACCRRGGKAGGGRQRRKNEAAGRPGMARRATRSGRPASVKTVEFVDLQQQDPKRSFSQSQFPMTQLSAGGGGGSSGAVSASASTSTLRRHTWQTRGGGGGGSILVGNGSVNTLCSNGSEDCDDDGNLLRGGGGGGTRLFSSRPRPRDLFLPVLSCVCLVSAYVACGAILLAEAQGWTAAEALYFCFVALCTVGFGGLRPEDPHLLPCVLYLFFGLAVLSTCLHLLRDEAAAAAARRKRRRRAAADTDGLRQQRGSVMSSLESLGKVRGGGAAAGRRPGSLER